MANLHLFNAFRLATKLVSQIVQSLLRSNLCKLSMFKRLIASIDLILFYPVDIRKHFTQRENFQMAKRNVRYFLDDVRVEILICIINGILSLRDVQLDDWIKGNFFFHHPDL